MSIAQLAVPTAAPSRSFTILHITAPATFGGLERVVEGLAVGHGRLGHRVHVAAVLGLHDPEPPFLAALRQHCVFVHTLRTGSHGYRAERAFIAGLVRSVRPDIVHTHGFRSDVIDSGVARRLGVPVVSTVHGFTRGRARTRLYEWLQRRWHRRFDAVVTVSRAQAVELASCGVDRDKLFHLQNAWVDGARRLSSADAREALRVEPGEFHVGWVGRMSREKGPDVFLHALQQFAQRSSLPFRVSLIGDGPDLPQLRQLADSLGIAPHLLWHGALSDAARYFEAFDVFVMSSRTEGTPIVLFEAMAARVPVVATSVGGIPDVVGPSEANLVASEDAVALAAALQAVRENPERARAQTDAALTTLHTQFDARAWLSAYESIYTRVAKPKRRL